jgi:hypothetical protein|tara:strand:- start:5473 stop:6336 length:864 start_codon:yes stop_codon:yes gene_type:complete
MQILNYLALATSIGIASIAAYFSVLGLATIFAGAYLEVIIMTGTLEFGKLVTAAYLHLAWERLNYMKWYLVSSVVVLMLITSLGIFGFLSKANIEQTLQGDSFSLEMSIIQKRIDGEEGKLSRLENRLVGLDQIINTAQPKDRNYIDRKQKEERQQIAEDMDLIIDQVVHYNEEMMPLRREQLMQEGEIGPIKYVAEVIYGQEKAPDMVDNAVRWVIFALIFVFDPLAVLLLVSSAGLIAGKDKVVVKKKVAPVKKKTPVAKPQEKVTNKIVFQVPKDRVLDLSKDK